MRMTVIHVAILMLGILLGYTNCGRFKSSSHGGGFGEFSSMGCEAPIAQTFSRTFHPFLKSARCTSCHNTTQTSIPGDFADPEFHSAFKAFMSDGYALNSSRLQTLVYNATHDHQGAGNAEYSVQVQGFVSELNRAVEQANACSGNLAGVGYTSAPTVVPDSGKGILTFNLDHLSPQFSTQGAILTLEAEVYKDSTGNEALLLSHPILTTGTRSLEVKEIFVKLNGQAIPLATTFSEIDSLVEAQQTEALLPPDRSSMILPIPTGAKGMSLQIVISDLK